MLQYVRIHDETGVLDCSRDMVSVPHVGHHIKTRAGKLLRVDGVLWDVEAEKEGGLMVQVFTSKAKDRGQEDSQRIAAQLKSYEEGGTIERLFEAVVHSCNVHRAVNAGVHEWRDAADRMEDILEELYLPLGLCPETGRKL